MPNPILIPADRLRDFAERLFRSAGSSEREARLIAVHLVEANLKGHDSHGIGSIPVYVGNIRSGDLPLGESLETVLDTGSMLIVDGRGGDVVTTDGPYAESKEQMGGFWVLEAADLDAAIDLARRGSAACNGKVEVRPFQDDV